MELRGELAFMNFQCEHLKRQTEEQKRDSFKEISPEEQAKQYQD